MAYTESVEYDQITVTNPYSSVGVRKSVVVKKDGVEIARNIIRYGLTCGNIDASDNFVDTDLSAEPAAVVSICNAAWTDAVKSAWKAKLIADKSTP